MLEIIIFADNSVRNWDNVMRPTFLFNEGQRRKYFEIKCASRSVLLSILFIVVATLNSYKYKKVIKYLFKN